MPRRTRALVNGPGLTRWVTVDTTGEERITHLVAPDTIEDTYLEDDINLFYNGKFEVAARGVEGWISNSDPEHLLITRETAAPLAGTGSMKLAIVSDSGGVGVYQTFTLNNPQFDLRGETWRISFKYRGSNNTKIMVFLDYSGVSDEEPLHLTATSTTQTASEDLEIPGAATAVQIHIATDWNEAAQTGKSFWLDDIKFVKVADA